jgi:hypothetical protein
MHKQTMALGVLAGLGLLAISGPASAGALSCTTGNNTVTVDSSNACAPTPGQNTQQVDETTLAFNPGGLGPYEWTYLDRDNRSNDTFLDHDNNQIPGAEGDWFLGSITDPGGHRNGTFTIDASSYAALGYDTFMIHIKTGNDGGYFLLDGPAVDGFLSGTFSVTGLPGCTQGNCRNGTGISHLTLFGINGSTDVPEPGSLVLLGLGLLGLGMLAGARRTADPRA